MSAKKKIFVWLACILGGLVILCVAGIIFLTAYLTPDRLSNIIKTESAKYMDAEITAVNPRFTIWSSFPQMKIEIDSLHIKSYALRNLSDSVKVNLPKDYQSLASTGRIQGSLNILKLLKGKISIGKVLVGHPEVNLVAVNDSSTNFNIIRKKIKTSEMPSMSFDTIRIEAPISATYTDLKKGIDADVDMMHLLVKQIPTSADSYALSLAGDMSLRQKGEQVLKDFPFDIAGNFSFNTKPLRVSLSDGNLHLATLTAAVNTELALSQNEDSLTVRRLECNIGSFSLDSVMQKFPGLKLPIPQTVKTDVHLMANAKLTDPYSLPLAKGSKPTELPSVVANIDVAPGDLAITGPDGRQNHISHSLISCNLTLDGRHPEATHIEIPEFSVNGGITDMKLRAYVADILGDPEIRVAAAGNTDISLAGHVITPLRQYKPSGLIASDAVVSFRMSNMEREDLENVRLKGDISLKNYSFTIPQKQLKAKGDKLAVNFGTTARELSLDMVDNGILDVQLNSNKLDLSGQGINTSLAGIKVKGKVARRNISAPQKFNFTIKADSVSASMGEEKFYVNELTAMLDAKDLHKTIKPAAFKMPAAWTADSKSMWYVGHTPQYISVNLPKKFKDIISHWKTHLLVKAKSGEVLTPVLPLHNGFGNLEMEASFDSVNLKHLDFNSQDTRLHLSAGVSNLRQFLTSGKTAPLRLAVNVAIDTVQINQLAGAYNRGLQLTHGPKASVLTVIPDTLTPSDTISLLIPRNIIADIKASAMMTKYTDLEMHNLATGLIVRDGKLQVKDLGIDTGFGALRLNFAFDTSDIQRIGMNMQMGLADVNLVDFFSNFHTLLLMMPQMRNIKGDLSILAEAKLLLFPNMYFNMPSIWADLYVNGRDLSLHQDKFIRRITRMMLIRDKGDIHLSDMNIHASVHDNLMELYPFDISFNNYSLQFGGLNNFDGDMYYHIGINKSPVPFPFGINLKGDFKHPEIRFGGATYKTDQGELISSSVMEKMRVNLPLQLKCLIREMIEKAAEADKTPASFYTY